jgi:hypothetical protein
LAIQTTINLFEPPFLQPPQLSLLFVTASVLLASEPAPLNAEAQARYRTGETALTDWPDIALPVASDASDRLPPPPTVSWLSSRLQAAALRPLSDHVVALDFTQVRGS